MILLQHATNPLGRTVVDQAIVRFYSMKVAVVKERGRPVPHSGTRARQTGGDADRFKVEDLVDQLLGPRDVSRLSKLIYCPS